MVPLRRGDHPKEDVLGAYAADTRRALPEEDTAALTEPTLWALFWTAFASHLRRLITDAEVLLCAGGNRVRYLLESDVPGEHFTVALPAKRC